MPHTLEEHITWTRNEWGSQKYFIDIIGYLKDKKIKSMIDAGGCTGEVSKICYEKIPTLESIIVVEASKNNAKFIKNNLNNLNINVEVLNNALYYGKDSITIGLATGDDNVGGYSVNLSDTVIQDSVKTITLESIIGQNTVDFLKLDVEGSEKNIIENSKKLKEIRFLDIEFHDEFRTNWKPLVKELLPEYFLIYEHSDHAFLELK